MDNTPAAPSPGWYPDPQVPGQTRFWDGTAWTEQRYRSQPSAKQLGLRFAMLGQVIRMGLILSLMIGTAEVLLYGWGLSIFDDAIADRDFNRLSRFDDLNRVLTISEVVVFAVTGVIWLVWQYQLAGSITPGDLERTPGWHVGSYFVPLGNLWMPFQNMRDLWRRLVAVDALLVGCWWTTTVLASVFVRIGSAQDSSGGLSSLKTEVGWWLASSAIGIPAALLALVVVHRLTVGGLALSASGGTGMAGPDSFRTQHLPNLRRGQDGPGGTSGSRPIS